MNYTTPSLDFTLPDTAFTFDPLSLYALLCQLPDRRGLRGRRYHKLAPMLLIYVLAKLCDADHPAQVAHWVTLRAPELISVLKLTYPKMPHPTTWRFWLRSAVDAALFSQMVSQFFAQAVLPQPSHERASLVVAIDGKVMRHAIPAARAAALHLLAAYVPHYGCVLAQIEVENKKNEISATPKLLELLDLRGMIVTGDAMFTQRHLASKIVAAGGDYLFIVKGNQPQLRSDIEFLFAQEEKDCPAGAGPNDFERDISVDKVSGRVEERILTSSMMLNAYAPFPHLGQVFRIEREVRSAGGTVRREVGYGLTSLPRTVADAARLQALVREHWGIENGLHYRRDCSLREDDCINGSANAGELIAAINNLVVGLCRGVGQNLAAVRRRFAAHPALALALLTS